MIKNSNLKKTYLLSGATALMLGILFLISAISFISSSITGNNCGWHSTLQNNWLIVIFKLHAGLINIQDDPLHGLNLLDIIILVVFSITCLGLHFNLRKSSRIWSLIATILSLIAILLFLITQIAGRSTVMLSVLIFSLVMIKDKIFSKVTIYTGILASVFLFVGDLSVGIHSNFITILFGIGYILLTLWFFLISRTLYWLGSNKNE
ncbi:MAG: hypothetical protein Q8868_13010 [Bacteroidota bacterium]|nr:hypothetical protein [Bacteroidota bacterium]